MRRRVREMYGDRDGWDGHAVSTVGSETWRRVHLHASAALLRPLLLADDAVVDSQPAIPHSHMCHSDMHAVHFAHTVNAIIWP